MNPRLDITPQVKKLRYMKNCVVIVKHSEEIKEVLCRTEIVNNQARISCSRRSAVGALSQNKDQFKFLETLGLRRQPTVPVLQVYRIYEPNEQNKQN